MALSRTAKRSGLTTKKATRVLFPPGGPDIFTLPPRFASGRVGASPGRAPLRYRNRRPSPPTAKRGGDPPAREAPREGDDVPRALHPPAALREREGRRFAGEGSPTGTATADPPR